MKRVHVKIFGDVQGVGFRQVTQFRASNMGVKGWVKNNQDGSVEAVFEGDDNNVDDMVEFCKIGPPGSHVERTEITEEKYSAKFNDFRIS